ncbi:asparaginase [Ferviditalea candida]|uniref:Asparaginase n=1 Tax=Ferviditalea candida TaxID=3108399 RepID=A0ABU5ZG98_9BACL|nr:asparaginase [Paenibacillaceae bacterium T2]
MDAETIVHVIRGSLIESRHRGHIAVVDHQGRLMHSLGNPEIVTFARSSAKLLQAIPVVESGAADFYQFSDEETAVICASHSGEPAHLNAVLSILAKTGLGPEYLQCGVHPPFDSAASRALAERREEPSSLHNNCSGKHSGMLALAKFMGVPTDRYLSIEHPVQKRMLSAVAEMADLPESQIPLGTDGCGVPVFGLPVSRLALAFARLSKNDGLSKQRSEACNRILRSIRRKPFYLAGTNRFDTRLIEVTGGRIIGKMGAEGVFALAIPERGWGIAVKVEDGAKRALYPTVTETLRQLHLLNDEETAALQPFHTPAHSNWQGQNVGRIEPAFTLKSSAAN